MGGIFTKLFESLTDNEQNTFDWILSRIKELPTAEDVRKLCDDADGKIDTIIRLCSEFSAAYKDVNAIIKNELQKLTATDVGARPDTWTPTAAEVGAAPSGYGLGNSSPKVVDGVVSLDSAKDNGWYYVTGLNWSSFGGVTLNLALMFVISKDRYHIRQILFPAGTNTIIRREFHGESWTDWCCENPPMNLGVEYRTTERWDNKSVYTKLVNLGAASNGKKVSHGITSTGIIRAAGKLSNIPMPVYNSENFNAEISVTDNEVIIYETGYNGVLCTAQLWYVK